LQVGAAPAEYHLVVVVNRELVVRLDATCFTEGEIETLQDGPNIIHGGFRDLQHRPEFLGEELRQDVRSRPGKMQRSAQTPGKHHLRNSGDKTAIGTIVDRKSTRLNSSHVKISYAVFCLKKKKEETISESCASLLRGSA